MVMWYYRKLLQLPDIVRHARQAIAVQNEN
jgi:hypothetical protein